MPTQDGGLGGKRVGEGVGALGVAASVEGHEVALGVMAGQLLGSEQGLAESEADVVHPLGHLRTVIVDGSLDPVVLIRLIDNGVGVLEEILRALVHRETGNPEPAISLEMPGEVGEEGICFSGISTFPNLLHFRNFKANLAILGD